jgi:hypothetical protein
VSLLHHYAFITSLTLFLCSSRNLLFRLISHPIYGAAIWLNPFNLLLALYPLAVAKVLTCLLTIFCVFFPSTLSLHISYISISPSSNSESPRLICPNATPIPVKFPRFLPLYHHSSRTWREQ